MHCAEREAFYPRDSDVQRLLTRLHPLLPALQGLTAPLAALPALPAFSRLKYLRLLSLPEQHWLLQGTSEPMLDLSAVACLPALEMLELAGDGTADIARLDLRGLARLRVLTLWSVKPVDLALRGGVAVRLLNLGGPSGFAEPVWQGVHVQHLDYYESYSSQISNIDLPSKVGTGHVESISINGRVGGVGNSDFTCGARGLKCLFIPQLQHLQHLEILTECQVELLIPACMPLKSLVIMASCIYLDYENLARFAEGVDRVKLGFTNSPRCRLQIPKEGPLEDRKARDRQHYGWKGVIAFTATLFAAGVRISQYSERARVLREKPMEMEDRIVSLLCELQTRIKSLLRAKQGDQDEPSSDARDSEEPEVDACKDPLEGTLLLYERVHA